MGYGLLNVWVREPENCSVSDMDGYAWARPCCNQRKIYQVELKNGHAEIKVPPGCYIVDAAWRPGCCGTAKETIAIVKCNETVCVNLIREWAGDPRRRYVAFSSHGKAAGLEEKEIGELIAKLEKIAESVPKGKIRSYTEDELTILEKVSDKEHKELLDKYRSLLEK